MDDAPRPAASEPVAPPSEEELRLRRARANATLSIQLAVFTWLGALWLGLQNFSLLQRWIAGEASEEGDTAMAIATGIDLLTVYGGPFLPSLVAVYLGLTGVGSDDPTVRRKGMLGIGIAGCHLAATLVLGVLVLLLVRAS